MVAPYSDKISRVPPYSWIYNMLDQYGAFTLYGCAFQHILITHYISLAWSQFARHYYGSLVDFLSSGYLDVSVPRVSLYTLYIQMQIRQKS